MSLSWYEYFTGVDWARYSTITAKISTLSCLGFGAAAIILHVWAMGFYSLFVGLVLMFFEMPFVYTACVGPRCEDYYKNVIDGFFFKLPLSRAVLHLSLSIFLFTQNTICIAAGIMLLISSLLYLFATVNRSSDISDGLTTDEDVSASDNGSNALLASNKFGTF